MFTSGLMPSLLRCTTAPSSPELCTLSHVSTATFAPNHNPLQFHVVVTRPLPRPWKTLSWKPLGLSKPCNSFSEEYWQPGCRDRDPQEWRQAGQDGPGCAGSSCSHFTRSEIAVSPSPSSGFSAHPKFQPNPSAPASALPGYLSGLSFRTWNFNWLPP